MFKNIYEVMQMMFYDFIFLDIFDLNQVHVQSSRI